MKIYRSAVDPVLKSRHRHQIIRVDTGSRGTGCRNDFDNAEIAEGKMPYRPTGLDASVPDKPPGNIEPPAPRQSPVAQIRFNNDSSNTD